MNEVWTVWTVNDDMDTLLVGIATTEQKAYEMKKKLRQEFEDSLEYMVCRMETNKLNINDNIIEF